MGSQTQHIGIFSADVRDLAVRWHEGALHSSFLWSWVGSRGHLCVYMRACVVPVCACLSSLRSQHNATHMLHRLLSTEYP